MFIDYKLHFTKCTETYQIYDNLLTLNAKLKLQFNIPYVYCPTKVLFTTYTFNVLAYYVYLIQIKYACLRNKTSACYYTRLKRLRLLEGKNKLLILN